MPHHPSKAHSVEVIDRRLRAVESEASPDPLELISLHDELSRVERKWLEKAATKASGTPHPNDRTKGQKPLANPALHNARVDRLTRLIAVAMRNVELTQSPQITTLLSKAHADLQSRKPLPEEV